MGSHTSLQIFSVTKKLILREFSNLSSQIAQVWPAGTLIRVPAQQPWAPFIPAPRSLSKHRFLLCHDFARDMLYWHGLTLILTWISNKIHHKMRDEICIPSQTSVVQFNPTIYWAWDFLFRLGLKLIRADKRAPSSPQWATVTKRDGQAF